MKQLDSENADRDLSSLVTVLTHTPSATVPMRCQALIQFGDGTKNLDGTGGDFEVVITVGGQTLEPSPQVVTFSTAVRAQVFTAEFPVPANAEVVVKALSPNAADTDVDVTAVIYDVESVTLADDAIMAGTFDESTAYPLKSADTGATALARTGEDSDTLETLSDQIDGTAQTSALPANFSSLAIDTDGCVSADIIKIRGSELAAKILAARNYAYRDDAIVTVELEADDTDAEKGAKLAAAYAAAKLLTPGGAAISSTNRVKVKFPDTRYDMGESDFTLDTNGIDLFAMVPEVGGDNLPTDNDLSNGTTPLTQCRAPSTCIYTTTLGHHTIEQSAADVRMSGFGILHLGTGATTEGCHALYVSATDNAPSIYDRMYFWHRAPYLSTTVARQRFPVGFAKHVKGIWKWCIANSAAWRVGYDAEDESVLSVIMEDCQFGSWSVAGDYLSGHKGTHKVTNTTMRRCKGVGCYAGSSSGYACVAGCGQWALDLDNTCVFEYLEIGDRGLGIGAKNEALQIYCRGGECCCGATTLSSAYNGEFAGTDIGGVFGAGSYGGVDSGQWDDPEIVRLTGTLIRTVVRDTYYPYRASGATIKNALIQMASGSNADCVVLMDSTSKITGSTLIADGTGKAVNSDSAKAFAGANNHYGGGLGANVTNTGTGDETTTIAAIAAKTTNLPASPAAVGSAMTLTAAYDPAKTAAQAGDAMTLANDAIKASTFDESTAYPLKSADTGATALARTGEDSDTLETLSDQIDGTAQTSALPANFSSLAIGSDGCVAANIGQVGSSPDAATNLKHVFTGAGHTNSVVLSAKQLKLTGDVESEGCLHVHNTNADGYGQYNRAGYIGVLNWGAAESGMECITDTGSYGMYIGGYEGLHIQGTTYGLVIAGASEAVRIGGTINVVDVGVWDTIVKTDLVAAIEAEIADDATGEAVKQAIVAKLVENLPDLDDLTLAAIASSVASAVLTTPANKLKTNASGQVEYSNTAPLDAAGVRSAVGLVSANLDTQLAGKALEATSQAILEDTGTTLPAAIAGIEAGTGGTVDVDIDVEDIIVE